MSALLLTKSSFKPRGLFLSVMLFLLSLTSVFAQSAVTGTVTDDEGLALIGVTIVEKGTTNGSVSDAAGNFRITVGKDAVLVFSYIGYSAQEVPVNGQSSLKATLKSSSNNLDEVVVVGYGNVRKSDLTGSVSSVGSEDFNTGPQLAPQQLIQGKIAGVNKNKNSPPRRTKTKS